MRILFIHPNDHPGGAEIAGYWPPAWGADLTGHLKAGGCTGGPTRLRSPRPTRPG